MKNMDDIDKIEDYEMELKKKYDEIVVPDYMFDTTKIFERARQLKIQQYKRRRTMRIASIVTILVISVVAISAFIINNGDKKNNNVTADGNGENNFIQESPKISGKICMKRNIMEYKNKDIEYICSVKINEILEYKIIDGVPSTKVKAEVVNNYYNNIEGEVEMIIPGGVFTIKEIKNGVNIEGNREIENFSEDESVAVEFYKDIYIPIAVKGKEYITTLNKENDIFYVCDNTKYGFKEYDVETNTIKDMDGNSVPVEMDKYLENL